MREWVTGRDINDAFLQQIRENVIQIGRDLSGSQGGNAQSIAVAVTQDAGFIGGATGRTEFRRLFVDFLWVDAQWRGIGLASETLHKLEALAVERGCVDAMIETFDDGIAAWYARSGYKLIALVPDYVGPWNRHTLLKSLGDGQPDS